MRSSAEAEKSDILKNQADELEKERKRLRELTEEVDKFRLKCDAQDLELRALREAVGDVDADGKSVPSTSITGDAPAAVVDDEEAQSAKREKARNLREQSKFAFDEMSKRIT